MPICFRVGIKTKISTADDEDDKSQPQGCGRGQACSLKGASMQAVAQYHDLTLHLLRRQRAEPREAPTPTKLIAHGKSGQKENGSER
jgi:hypothetical protein